MSARSLLAKDILSKINGLKTWIEIKRSNFRANCRLFRKLIGSRVKLWAVIKSNAYGHGIYAIASLGEDAKEIDGFCVDSFVEGLNLRKKGIKKPILVLGPTTFYFSGQASNYDITLTISNFETLKFASQLKDVPNFHIKLDTGMHRQGFLPGEIGRLIRFIKSKKKLSAKLGGIYTHFAAANDLSLFPFTDAQFIHFKEAIRRFRKSFPKRSFIAHCAATGATLFSSHYHQQAVRIGIGLYGFPPALDFYDRFPDYRLLPVLSWRVIISEVKEIPAGEFIGYDLSFRTSEKIKLAILPIGYWHGFPRALSNKGEVLIKGKRAKVLGKVSMDLLGVNVSNIRCAPGDIATILGKDGDDDISAFEFATLSSTVHYEALTRINPLIKRVIV